MRVPHQDLPPLDGALRAAIRDLGCPEHDDYHAPGATGLSRVALTFRDGRRIDTHHAYLVPARDRDNLTIRCETLVDRVLLDGRRVLGVRTAAGEDIRAGEVILSAGALHSPAILLRSGVGTADGLPVGRGLQDHAATPGCRPVDPIVEFDMLTDDAIDAWLRANVNDYVHATRSCRMGRRGDPSAVVDNDCRVIGYEGLRVCGASVMPALPKANTHTSPPSPSPSGWRTRCEPQVRIRRGVATFMLLAWARQLRTSPEQ